MQKEKRLCLHVYVPMCKYPSRREKPHLYRSMVRIKKGDLSCRPYGDFQSSISTLGIGGGWWLNGSSWNWWSMYIQILYVCWCIMFWSRCYRVLQSTNDSIQFRTKFIRRVLLVWFSQWWTIYYLFFITFIYLTSVLEKTRNI